MPDIAMCAKGCPRCLECYRFRAVPTPHWQPYGNFDPKGLSSCDYFWEIKPGQNVRDIKEFAEVVEGA